MQTPEALGGLAQSFTSVAQQLRERPASAFKYRIVSHRTTRAFNQALGKWVASERSSPPPQADPVELRAEIYGFGRSSSDAHAYRAVFLTTCVELMEAAMPALQRGKIAIPMTLTRSLIERISVASNLARVTLPILQQKSVNREDSFDSLASAGDNYTVALHGTRLDWQKIGQPSVTAIEPKRARYTSIDHSLDLSAKQILNHIDKLDQLHPGARVSYEIMCEFLHPNVGDFYSSILTADSSTDWLGVRHLEFTIGAGSSNIANAADLDLVVAQALRNAQKLVLLIPQLDRELWKLAETISWRTRKIIRPLIKQHPSLFLKSDHCPCQSGKLVMNCCGT